MAGHFQGQQHMQQQGHPMPPQIHQHPGHPQVHQQQHPPQMAPLHAYGLPVYLGLILRPTVTNGKPDWEHMQRPAPLEENQDELARLAKKSPYKPSDSAMAKNLEGDKKIHLDRMLNEFNLREEDPSIQWKIVSIKLEQKELVSGIAALVASKKITRKMQVIFKKDLKPRPTATRHASISLPIHPGHINIPQTHHQTQHPALSQSSPMHDPRFQPGFNPGLHGGNGPPPPPPPPPPAAHGHPLFGEQQRGHGHENLAPGMIKLGGGHDVEVLGSDDDDDEFYEEEPKKKKGKAKDSKTKLPKIHMPEIPDHKRFSKVSSKSSDYDDDTFSRKSSSVTSLSSSPANHGHFDKRRPSHSKNYHEHRRNTSLGSLFSNDSFVVTPHNSNSKRHERGKYGSSHSYRSQPVEDWSRTLIPPHQHRESDAYNRELERTMEKLRIDSLERKAEAHREQQHQAEMANRLDRLEAGTVPTDRRVDPYAPTFQRRYETIDSYDRPRPQRGYTEPVYTTVRPQNGYIGPVYTETRPRRRHEGVPRYM